MNHTKMTIKGDKFYINGELTYSEIDGCPYRGLLMNARFIQGIYDDKTGRERYIRFGKSFDPDQNTDELIESLPEWYQAGLRAFTVGLQGGGPCFTIPLDSIDNNPYGSDGKNLDQAYLSRLARLIDAADRQGMVVIVSLFYGVQSMYLTDDDAVEQAVTNICRWLKDRDDKNVIIEAANEHNISAFECHKVLSQENGILRLMEIAKKESGGLPVGCSGTGGYFSERIAKASDVILIHGNAQSRNLLYNLIKKAKAIQPARPIVVNEDSQALSQMKVTFQNGVSWGYYNNMTKQEPPTVWGITKGEDAYFALRMQEYLTGKQSDLPFEDQFYLQGLEKDMAYEGKRFIRLASLYPEQIDYVEFYRDGILYEQAYDDPFVINFIENWWQGPVTGIESGEDWKAVVHLRDGKIIEKRTIAE
ncbi:hypothetical protein HMPREF1093_00011 [Hungatella hathewayi 12489931]|uniref:cellulase family glycosylhydrolase n=1 Tax=Hungatella hathewayi TaxID=154046 RepID=UPI0002D1C75E|nr:cellulase family glycosylhydrolase [Hungatella hathewayi]ENY98801.1 hypothetical protein HMPREF1093_00011 [Hungatella hathewayi 12489931]